MAVDGAPNVTVLLGTYWNCSRSICDTINASFAPFSGHVSSLLLIILTRHIKSQNIGKITRAGRHDGKRITTCCDIICTFTYHLPIYHPMYVRHRVCLLSIMTRTVRFMFDMKSLACLSALLMSPHAQLMSALMSYPSCPSHPPPPPILTRMPYS